MLEKTTLCSRSNSGFCIYGCSGHFSDVLVLPDAREACPVLFNAVHSSGYQALVRWGQPQQRVHDEAFRTGEQS